MHLSHILNHLGEERNQYFNAVAPPIIQTSNFHFNNLSDFRQAFTDELKYSIYTRGNNPTVAMLRKKLAALENTEDCLVFGSGVAAISSAIIGNVKAGDHIVCVKSPYSWTQALLTKFLPRFNVTHTFVDGTNLEAIEQAIQPNTTLLFLESPNSLTFELQDIEACAQLAKKYNLISAIDNSYASPLYQKPADLGIDIVVHSGTKYINGHSDVVVGVLCAKKEMVKKIFESEFMTLGAILSPTEAAMVLRGLRTFPIRMNQIFQSTQWIVQKLEKHPKVEKIYYPFSTSHPQYQLAKKQMSGTGGLFSIALKAETLDKAEAFFHALQRFLLAVSWGGHESLVLPVCGLYNIPGRENPTTPWNLFRFSIGLEDPEWLWEDLQRGFSSLK